MHGGPSGTVGLFHFSLVWLIFNWGEPERAPPGQFNGCAVYINISHNTVRRPHVITYSTRAQSILVPRSKPSFPGLHAPSNRQPQLATSYRRHENLKKRTYKQCIREVEHGSFTPLVLSATGGLGRAATVSYRRLSF